MPRLGDPSVSFAVLSSQWVSSAGREVASAAPASRRTPRPLPVPPEREHWWTVDEAAAALRTSRSRVFRLIREKVLRKVDAPGRKTMVTRASVEAYRDRLSSGRTRPSARKAAPPPEAGPAKPRKRLRVVEGGASAPTMRGELEALRKRLFGRDGS